MASKDDNALRRLHRSIHDHVNEALAICEQNDLDEHAAETEQLADVARQAERLVADLRRIAGTPAGAAEAPTDPPDALNALLLRLTHAAGVARTIARHEDLDGLDDVEGLAVLLTDELERIQNDLDRAAIKLARAGGSRP